MKFPGIISVLIILITSGCAAQPEPDIVNRSRWIDDVVYDEDLDDTLFKPCEHPDYTFQYFNDSKGILYKGGKPAIIEAFKEFKNPGIPNQSGLIRIRFIVNCKGEAGYYRLFSSDLNYKPKEFSKQVTDQLLNITKTLQDWQAKEIREHQADYYQYLIFRLEDGHITAILP